MVQTRRCSSKTHEQLAREWDNLATIRSEQILKGEDLSFVHVSVPAALQLLEPADMSSVLEVGCGTGHFTAILAKRATYVTAIDPSTESIAVARHVCIGLRNVELFCASLEGIDAASMRRRPTSAVALMALMSTPNLHIFAKSLANLLPKGATFAAVFCHPWFWPRYWGYEKASWFRYSEEIFIEAPFTISNARANIMTTHIHRPLELYLNVFSDAGFSLSRTLEPFPSEELNAQYPSMWEFPRFLGLQWIKGRS